MLHLQTDKVGRVINSIHKNAGVGSGRIHKVVGAGSRFPWSNGSSAATEGQTALGGLTEQLLLSFQLGKTNSDNILIYYLI